jgi:hypothetical protein
MTRRMTVMVLTIVGLMVLVATVSPPDQGGQERSTATPAPAPATDLTDPDAFDVTETLSAAPGSPERTVSAELGDRVELVVEGTEPDAVLLGSLASKSVEAGIPARFEILADTPGEYPLILTNSNRRIGTLEIR